MTYMTQQNPNSVQNTVDLLESLAAETLKQKPFSSADVTIPCTETQDSDSAPVQSITYKVDLRQYSQEALNAVLYTYSGQFFIEQKLNAEGTEAEVKLLLKDLASSLNAQEQRQLRGEFYQNLIDQQVRLDLEQRFGHIRDLLVAEAFKPVN